MNRIGIARPALALFLAVQAQAALAQPTGGLDCTQILSNLPSPFPPADQFVLATDLGRNFDDVAKQLKAVGFTTGDSTFVFESAGVMLENQSNRELDLLGGIHVDEGGNPGAQLVAFLPRPIPANTSVRLVFSTLRVPEPGFLLEPNTTYWIVLDAEDNPGADGLNWQQRDPAAAPVAIPGITFEGYRFDADGGASWSNSSIFNAVRISACELNGPVPGSILQPAAVTTTYQEAISPNVGGIRFSFDQSGLSHPYISGLTEFDSYVATTGHSNSNSTMMLINSNGQNQPGGVVELGGTITLDLGGSLSVDALGLWAASTSESITRMAVYTDLDDDFGNGGTSLLGTFDVVSTRDGQAFEFAATETRFVHIEVLGHGGGSFLRHGEFAARVAADEFVCSADTNGDGLLTPADFNGWVIAFNNQDPACDQNGDGLCTPADFNSWIINFNAGCD